MNNSPLAEILRPKTLDDVLGQEHLTGKNGTIRKMLENDTINSLIFWGPPGTGKDQHLHGADPRRCRDSQSEPPRAI